MRSKNKQSNRKVAPVYRAIKRPAPEIRPGDVGRDAVAAAALHQLTRYAQDVQAHLEASQMRQMLDRIEHDLNPTAPAPKMRLRRT